MTDPANPSKPRRGCLFYGCLTGIVALVAILVAGLLGLHQLRKMMDRYTDDKPLPLPTVEISTQRFDQLERRVETFRDDLRAGRKPSSLTLTSDEINALIAKDPQFSGLKGKVYVALEGQALKAQISLPLAELGLPRLKGRYLNGTGVFSLSLQNGMVDVRAQELTVKGRPLPATYMNAIRNQNLAASANDNPQSSVGLNRLQNLEVQDGELRLIPKDVQ
jgi:hypothetical protein